MSRAIHKTLALCREPVLYLLMFSGIVHLLTSDSVSLWTLVAALFMVLIMAAAALTRIHDTLGLDRDLLWVITALGAGFWMFNAFRYAGLAHWPLAHPRHIQDYVRLLFDHAILAVNVLPPVMMACVMLGHSNTIRWGSWGDDAVSPTGRILLVTSALLALSMAVGSVLVTARHVQSPWLGFFLICTIKAGLTSGTEELCYRGILQPLCVTRFGVVGGIIFQACLYTAFHMHLGAVFFPGLGFLFGVFLLGLIFGAVSRVTTGIGWAFVIHLSLNIVIEWQNIL